MKKTLDPITSFRKRCMDAGLLTTEQVKGIDKQVKKHIEEETEAALSSPEPPLETIAHNITKTSVPYTVRSCTSFAEFDHATNI